MKDKYLMEWLMDKVLLRMQLWFIQEIGDVIKDMEKEKKISSKTEITIQANT